MPKKQREKLQKITPILFETKIIEVTTEMGIVEHFFAVLGNIDHDKDRIMSGAFTKTLAEQGVSRVRVLDAHNARSATDVIGSPLSIAEVGRDQLPPDVQARFPEATGGMKAQTRFNLKTAKGNEVFQLLKAGDLQEWSFGYAIIKADFETVKAVNDRRGWTTAKDGDEIRVQNLRELELFEYSPVVWGANSATSTTDAKDKPEPEQAKTVPAMQSWPLAPRDRAWDSAAAVGRLRSWAGGPDPGEIDWGKYSKGHFWYDGESRDRFGSYKLPYADIIDGKPHAVPRAIFAVAGGRGVNRADIPDADKARIRSQVNRWYARMRDEFADDSIVSPFAEGADREMAILAAKLEAYPPECKSTNLGDQIEGLVRAFYAEYPNMPEMAYWVREIYDDHLIVAIESGGDDGLFRVNYHLDQDGKPIFAHRDEWVEVVMVYVPKDASPATGAKLPAQDQETLVALAGLKQTVGAALAQAMMAVATGQLEEWHAAGHITADQYVVLSASVGRTLGTLAVSVPPSVKQVEVPGSIITFSKQGPVIVGRGEYHAPQIQTERKQTERKPQDQPDDAEPPPGGALTSKGAAALARIRAMKT